MMTFFSNLSIVILVMLGVAALSSAITEAWYRERDRYSAILFLCLFVLGALAILPRLIKWLW